MRMDLRSCVAWTLLAFHCSTPGEWERRAPPPFRSLFGGGGHSFASMVQVISRLHALTSPWSTFYQVRHQARKFCDFTPQALFSVWVWGGVRGRGARLPSGSPTP